MEISAILEICLCALACCWVLVRIHAVPSFRCSYSTNPSMWKRPRILLRMVASVLIATISFISLILRFVHKDEFLAGNAVAQCALGITWVLSTCLLYMELRRGLTASLALRIFWLMALLIEIVEFSHICASFSVATDGHGYPLLVMILEVVHLLMNSILLVDVIIPSISNYYSRVKFSTSFDAQEPLLREERSDVDTLRNAWFKWLEDDGHRSVPRQPETSIYMDSDTDTSSLIVSPSSRLPLAPFSSVRIVSYSQSGDGVLYTLRAESGEVETYRTKEGRDFDKLYKSVCELEGVPRMWEDISPGSSSHAQHQLNDFLNVLLAIPDSWPFLVDFIGQHPHKEHYQSNKASDPAAVAFLRSIVRIDIPRFEEAKEPSEIVYSLCVISPTGNYMLHKKQCDFECLHRDLCRHIPSNIQFLLPSLLEGYEQPHRKSIHDPHRKRQILEAFIQCLVYTDAFQHALVVEFLSPPANVAIGTGKRSEDNEGGNRHQQSMKPQGVFQKMIEERVGNGVDHSCKSPLHQRFRIHVQKTQFEKKFMIIVEEYTNMSWKACRSYHDFFTLLRKLQKHLEIYSFPDVEALLIQSNSRKGHRLGCDGDLLIIEIVLQRLVAVSSLMQCQPLLQFLGRRRLSSVHFTAHQHLPVHGESSPPSPVPFY